MSASQRLLPLLAVVGLIGSCARAQETTMAVAETPTTSTPETIHSVGATPISAPISAPTSAPVSAPSSTEPEPATTTSTAAPLESATKEPLQLRGPVESVSVIGDSILFDLSRLGGRPNTITHTIHDTLRSTPGLENISVTNVALPGMATTYAFEFNGKEIPPLQPYVESLLRDDTYRPDLVIVAASAIDINILYDTPIDEIAAGMIETLANVQSSLEARGIQFMVLPAFKINDELYNKAQLVARPNEAAVDANYRVLELNRLLSASDLPMLFPNFVGDDIDNDGSPDKGLFTRHEGGLLNDGIHPNDRGELLYAENVLTFLTPLLLQANSAAGS